MCFCFQIQIIDYNNEYSFSLKRKQSYFNSIFLKNNESISTSSSNVTVLHCAYIRLLPSGRKIKNYKCLNVSFRILLTASDPVAICLLYHLYLYKIKREPFFKRICRRSKPMKLITNYKLPFN